MKLLIMIDMQKDFLDGALGNPETIAILPAVCERVKQAYAEKREIMFTLDTHFENYMETQEGRKLPVPHCIKDTEGWKLADELWELVKDLPQTRRIEKITFGSNEMPERIEQLWGKSLQEIELIGVCTDICVISNAMILKAFFPEVRITVNEACCAGTSAEAHNRAIEAMKMCQIEMKGMIL